MRLAQPHEPSVRQPMRGRCFELVAIRGGVVELGEGLGKRLGAAVGRALGVVPVGHVAVAEQVRDYLLKGEVRNSINVPSVSPWMYIHAKC